MRTDKRGAKHCFCIGDLSSYIGTLVCIYSNVLAIKIRDIGFENVWYFNFVGSYKRFIARHCCFLKKYYFLVLQEIVKTQTQDLFFDNVWYFSFVEDCEQFKPETLLFGNA